MRVAIVLVVVSACLALGQAASLGEVKRQNAKESKCLAMREILRELIDDLSTAEEHSEAASMSKDTNHAPYFDPDTYVQFIKTYTDVKPGERIGYVTAYDDDTWDKITFTMKSNDQSDDYFDLKTVENDAAEGKHKDARYPYICEIYLKKPFVDSKQNFNFIIEARDNGTIQKSAIKNVEIHVKKHGDCLPGYTYAKVFDGCLKLVTDTASFSDAEAHCKRDQKEGGKTYYRPFLAQPSNDWQNDKMADLLKAMEKPVWVGAKFEPGRNRWFFRKFGGTIEAWTHWMPGEPGTYTDGQGERCAAMLGLKASSSENAGQWVELPCSGKLPFVCEHFKLYN